eukprot:gene17494-19244_t
MSQEKETSSVDAEEDLSKNPFLALFPSVQHAKDFIQRRKADLNMQKEAGPSESMKSSNKLSETPKLAEGNIEESASDKFVVNEFLERVFLFTVSSDKKQSSCWRTYGVPLPNCILLKGLHKELKEKKALQLLDSDNLNQALMERLLTNHKHIISYGERTLPIDIVSPPDEKYIVKYLAHSLSRLNDQTNFFKRKLKDLCLVEKLEELKSTCESLITSYAGSVLLSPEVFATSEPQKQLFDLLMRPNECKYLPEFLDAIVKEHNDNHDLSEMFLPMLDILMTEAKSITLMEPRIFIILEIILYFSQNAKLATVLVSSESWLRPIQSSASSTAGLDFERSTLIGPLLGVTTLSYDRNKPSEFFIEPSKQSQMEMEVVMNNCRRQIDIISSKFHTIFRNILEDKDSQQDLLYWIGACLYHNRKRLQLSFETGFASMLTQARDGFFLNLGNVMLKLCEPFLDLSSRSKKCLRINSLYCSVNANISDIARPGASVHLVQDQEEPKMAKRTDDMKVHTADGVKFKFVTECFFVTHKCLKIGFLKAASSYHSLLKKLQKLSEIYHDARAGEFHSEELEKIKTEFEQNIQRQLSFKAHLLNPSMAELVIKFCSVTSYWLTQQLLADDNFNDGQERELIIDQLEDKVYPALTVIPEYIIENIADCLIFFERFGDENIEKSTHHLQNIMICFSLFLGSPKRLNNPHLRAKLSEALAGLLPRKKDEPGIVSTKAGSKIFEECPTISEILPEALLKLFVDIEYTGHSMQFEQKFGYRHHMYAVLEYVWKIPSYNKVFWELFEEGRRYYCEKNEFSAFPRFINLLLNDSTFLLDEALQHLCKIREMEREKNEGEWRELSPQARQEKERTLFELSEMTRGYNIMANETVHVLCYISKDITRPFASPCMVEQTASFLNYFLLHLIGPKSKTLKVKDFDKFHFKPRELVKNIAQILLNLGNEKDFCHAIVSDGRSYSPELFTRAREVLVQLNTPQDVLDKFTDLSSRLEKIAETARVEEDNMPEPPEEFLDPILGTLMLEPVRLPSSMKILDKPTIARHLLSDPKDPFNRSPLTLDMVEPMNELKLRIEKWMDENGMKRYHDYTSEDCTG